MFGCRATYDEQVQVLCRPSPDGIVTFGACGSFQIANLNYNGFYMARCGYDQQGMLAWAQWCGDTPLCGGGPAEPCLTSTGAPMPIPSCQLANMCPRDGAAD